MKSSRNAIGNMALAYGDVSRKDEIMIEEIERGLMQLAERRKH